MILERDSSTPPEEFLSTEVYNTIKFFLYRNSNLNRDGILVCHPLHLAHAIRECITNAHIQDLRNFILMKRPLFPNTENPFSELVMQEKLSYNVSPSRRRVGEKASLPKAKRENKNFESTNKTFFPPLNQFSGRERSQSSGDESSFHLGDRHEVVQKQLTFLGQQKEQLKVPETIFTLLVGPLMKAEEETGFVKQNERLQRKKQQMQRFKRSVLT